MKVFRAWSVVLAAFLSAFAKGQCEGGVIIAEVDTICEGSDAQLVISDFGGPDSTVRWQSRTGPVWSDIAGETSVELQVTPLADTWYRCLVGCTNDTVSSDSVLVVLVEQINVLVSASSGTNCGTADDTLIATGALSYAWLPVAGLSPSTGDTAICTSTTTTTYTVTGSSGPCTDAATIEVFVTPIPVVDIISSQDGPFCDAVDATFSVNGMDSLNWSPITGLAAASGSPVECTATTTTTYTATGWLDGCSGTDVINVVVNAAPPPPTITADGPLIFCEGDSVLLSTDATNPVWNTDETGPTITVTTSGTYVVVDSVPGCGAVSSDPASVTVNPFPAPTCPGDTLVCLTSAPFALEPVTPGGSFSYGGLFDVDSAGTGPHSIVYTLTAGGCTGTCSMSITVEDPPDAGSDGTLSVCANGGPVDLEDELGPHDAGGTWSGPGGSLPDGSYDPELHDPGTYEYSVAPMAVCATATAIVLVTETAPPTAPAPQAIGMDSVCAGQYMDITLASMTDGTSYAWSCSGCLLTPDTGSTVEALWNGTGQGSLSVTATVSGGCNSTTTLPVAVSPDPASCPRGMVFFEPHGLAVLDSTANYFQWGTLEGNAFSPIADATAQTLFHTSIVDCDGAGYAVRTSIHGTCWSTTVRCADAETLTRPCLSGQMLVAGPELRVFPNPWCGGPLTVTTGQDNGSALLVSVVDPLGRVQYSARLAATGGVIASEVLERLPRGPLVLRATIEGKPVPEGTSTLKLIVP